MVSGVPGCTVATLPPNHIACRYPYVCTYMPMQFQHPHEPGPQVIMRDRRYDSILIVRIECVAAFLGTAGEEATGLPRSSDAICDRRDIRYRNQPGPWYRLLRRVALPLRLIAGDASRESVDCVCRSYGEDTRFQILRN